MPGRGGLSGPDPVQEGQVVGVRQSLVADLGDRALLAVAVQHVGQHRQRLPDGGGGIGLGRGPGGAAVVAGQLGSRARAWHRIGELRGHGEHVSEVDFGATRQDHVGVLAVLRPGEHGQPCMHSPALSHMIGDRVPEFGITEMLVQKCGRSTVAARSAGRRPSPGARSARGG
jgi:hypothetical protein